MAEFADVLHSIMGDDLLWEDPLFNPPDLETLFVGSRVVRSLSHLVAQYSSRPKLLTATSGGALNVYDGSVAEVLGIISTELTAQGLTLDLILAELDAMHAIAADVHVPMSNAIRMVAG